MDLKRWLIALAAAALLIAPIGSSTALAAAGETTYSSPTYHDHDGESEDEDEGEGDEGGGGEGERGSLTEVLEGLGDLLRGVAKIVSGED